MAHQIIISDDDYASLQATAKKSGKPIDQLLHEAIKEKFGQSIHRLQGVYENPTGEVDSPDEDAELERIASKIGNAKPWLSEMVLEDRGPR